MLASGGFIGSASAGCTPGWTLIEEHDNSFDYDGGLFTKAKWAGKVQLWEKLDTNCYVEDVQVKFTGGNSGGRLDLMGSTIGVYYSVQYPQPYTDHPEHGQNPDAWGDAISWNPDGYFQLFYAHVHFDVNSRGADEYFLGVNTPLPVSVFNVHASFQLPLDLVGETVYAQIHLYPNLCQCVATKITIPGSTPPPPPEPGWAVYVHGHDDDWQLFSSPNTYYDYKAGKNLVFIVATAGDAGMEENYWRSREEAHNRSVVYLAGDATLQTSTVSVCHSSPPICHNIYQRTYGRTVTMFMRLPDGAQDGQGFPSTGFVSLAKLRDGLILSISALDGSATYNGWQDLYLTIKAAISLHAPYDSTTRVTSHDFDRVRQSFEGRDCNGCADHADHLAVADAIRTIAITNGAPWVRRWSIDYPIGWADSRYPPNLSPTDYQIKKDLFMVYSDRFRELTGIDIYADQATFWENCFMRNYDRSV